MNNEKINQIEELCQHQLIFLKQSKNALSQQRLYIDEKIVKFNV